MNLDDYQFHCLRTWNRTDLTKRERVINALLGIGESGEVLQLFKKAWFHRANTEPDMAEVTLELGDLLYYMSVLCSEYGIALSDVAEGNIEKLKARWPEGFTPAKAAVDVTPRCELCNEPMPPGEEMFKFHGFSGPCPPKGSAIQRAIDDGQA